MRALYISYRNTMREGAAGHLFSFFSYLRRFSFLLFVGAPIALGFRCFWYFLGGTPQRAQFFQKFVWHEIDDGQPEWSRGGAGPGQSAPPREHEEAAPAPETALKTARVRAGSRRFVKQCRTLTQQQRATASAAAAKKRMAEAMSPAELLARRVARRKTFEDEPYFSRRHCHRSC